MPSQLHEAHLLLFRNHPALAAELIRGALGVELPAFSEAREVSADLTEIQPAEYRADLVVELWADAMPVYGIVVEVQLAESVRKPFVWPAYVVNLRARLECPVALLVVTPDESVARWAARTVCLGGLHYFTPYVLGPSSVPVVTDEAQARQNPELAVLSAMAHGRDADAVRAIEIAIAAQRASIGLDADRSGIYGDLIMSSLGEAAREALKTMATQKYEFQSDFAKHYFAAGRAEGKAEGEAHGRAALVLRQLMTRFGLVEGGVIERVERASIEELDAIGERLLTAGTLQDALGTL
jgi:Domain of unknown function (DUF4351)